MSGNGRFSLVPVSRRKDVSKAPISGTWAHHVVHGIMPKMQDHVSWRQIVCLTVNRAAKT